MGRVPSTLHARLTVILQLCFNIEQEKGFIDVKTLAQLAGLTERMIRDYLEILLRLGVLEYLGWGRYRINRGNLEMVSTWLGVEYSGQLTLDPFIDIALSQEPLVRRIDERLKEIFERIGLGILFKENVKEKIRSAKIPGGEFKQLLGDRLIYPRAAKPIMKPTMTVAGSACDYSDEHYTVGNWSILSLIFIAGASSMIGLRYGQFDPRKYEFKLYPEIVSYKGTEPLFPTEPFYELVVDFPEVIVPVRRIVARLLAEIAKYAVDIEMLEEHGDDIEFYFRSGSLVPHGFTTTIRPLVELQNKCVDLMNRVISLARKKNVTLVGVSYKYFDDVFVRCVEELIGVKLGRTNDIKLLAAVLENGDTTCLVRREKERGRPKVENWYEFYVCCNGYPLKVEFIADGDPWEVYERVKDAIVTVSHPVTIKRKLRVVVPNAIFDAHTRAESHLDLIRKLTVYRIPRILGGEVSKI